jgi:periplasmic mercuric ion binding protein
LPAGQDRAIRACTASLDATGSAATRMKKLLSFTSLLLALSWSAQAAGTSVKLSEVHLCCAGCAKSIEKAVATVPGATAQADKDAGTVTITAPDEGTAQKAVDAAVAAGFFGKSSDPAIKVKGNSGAEKGKVQSLKISGVHLCCDKCANAVKDALSKVKGVKGTTVAKGAETFEVTGDFKAKPVFTALHKAGFSGKVSK